MAKSTILPRLDDILDAISGVETIIADLNFESYSRSLISRRAVERCIEIVSEASRHISVDLTSRYPEIPWHEIRGIGNRLRHEYGTVDDQIIWFVATRSLPELKPVIENLRAELESEQEPEA